MAGKNVVERIIGTASERATQRIQRAQAMLQRLEQDLEARRQGRDRLLVEDGPAASISAVRAEIRALEAARGDALEDLAAAQRAVEKASADAAARELAARWKRTRELCAERERVAAQAQAAAQALGSAWREMSRLQAEILGTVPAGGFRTSRIAEDWRDGTRAAVEQQLWIASDGVVAPGASGGYALSEFRRLAVDVPAKIAAQHRQLLAQQQPASTEPKAA